MTKLRPLLFDLHADLSFSSCDISKTDVSKIERSSWSRTSRTTEARQSQASNESFRTSSSGGKMFDDGSKNGAKRELSVDDISKPINVTAPGPYSSKLEPLDDPSVILTSPNATLPRRPQPGE